MMNLFVSMMAIATVSASHLDDVNGVFTSFDFDSVKFKTKTDCSLDNYPGVSITQKYSTNSS